jgi:hypothetical protein
VQTPRFDAGIGAPEADAMLAIRTNSASTQISLKTGWDHIPPRAASKAATYRNRRSITGSYCRRSAQTFSAIGYFLERKVMETFLIVLAIAAMAGICVFLFVIEPRRKIYD